MEWNAADTRWEYRVGYPGCVVDTIPDESVTIIALTHDLCKTYFYGVSERNAKVKNPATGREEWQKVPFYTVNDRMPIGGHGFKSAFLVKEYMTLTNQEFYAIRWHMGFSDAGEETNTLKAAIAKYPIVWAVHVADMIASYFMEAENGNAEKSNGFTGPGEPLSWSLRRNRLERPSRAESEICAGRRRWGK